MNEKNHIEEKHLLDKLRQDDEQAFEHIFNAYFNILFSYAYDFLERPFLAEDIVEDVFFRLWERREDIDITSSISNYLFRSVKNACLDHVKFVHVRQNYEDRIKKKAQLDESFHFHNVTSADPLKERELKKAIKKAVRDLPSDYRKVFKMNRHYRMTNKEIAEKLGLSSHTVGKYLNLAIERLRKSLKDFF